MLFTGIYFGISSLNTVNTYVKTEARVKNIEKSKKSITPIFEYTVKDKQYTIQGASTRPDAYVIGDKEIIYYNPNDPEEAKIDTFMSLWFLPVFLSGFSIILITVMVLLILFSKKKPETLTARKR